MKCPSCSFDNPDGMKFYGECAAPLKNLCPQCGFENPPGFKFCGECATPLSDQTPTPQPTPPQAPKDLSFEEKLDKIQRYLPGGVTEKILAQRGKIEGEKKQVTSFGLKGFRAYLRKGYIPQIHIHLQTRTDPGSGL